MTHSFWVFARATEVGLRSLLCLALLCNAWAWAAGGDLDRGFGAGAGYVTYGQPYEAHWQITSAVALADGRAVIGGYLDLKYLVRRYFPDGRLDASFGNQGTEELPDFARTSTSRGTAPSPELYLDPLGRVVVERAGRVRRLSADGRYDADFQPRIINLERYFDYDWYFAPTFLPLADGRMIVVTTQVSPTATDFISVRYFLADGSPDTQRGGAYGERLVGPSSGERYVPTHAAIQPDGRLLISAIWVQATRLGLVIIRLNEDGTQDPSFGREGVVVIGQDMSRVYSPNLAVNSEGKIALGYFVYGGDVVPSTQSYIIVDVLLPDGRTDTSQPMAGRLSLTLPDSYGYPFFHEWFRVVFVQSRLSLLAQSFFWQMNLASGGAPPAVSAYWTTEMNSAWLADRLGGSYLWRFKVHEPRFLGRSVSSYDNSAAYVFSIDAIASGQPTEIRYSEMAQSWTSIVSALPGTDGRVVAIGLDDEVYAFQKPGLYRFLDNGDVDPGFGASGLVANLGHRESRLLDTLGGGATAFGNSWVSGAPQFSVLRYDAAGGADANFGASGKVTLPGTGPYDALRHRSGDLWVVSSSPASGTEFRRYNAKGEALGRACLGVSGIGQFAIAAAFDDSLLVAFARADTILGPTLQRLRCASTGRDEPISATAPVPIEEHFAAVESVSVLPDADDGAVVALALSWNAIASQPRLLIVVLRLKPDGAIDTGFGDAGKIRIPIENQAAYTQLDLAKFRLGRQRDGKLVVAHNVPLGSGRAIVVGRYSPDGKPDGSFGAGGNHEVTISFGGSERVSDLTQTADGKLIVVGQSGRRGLMVRLYGEATAPPASPVPVIEFFNTNLNHYFSTGGSGEIAGIEAGAAGPGWQRTGLSFKAYAPESGIAPGALPVCRFYGTPGRGPNSHFYTVDATECELVKRDSGWTYEGTAFYLFPATNDQCAATQQPVYRAYNMRFAQNDSNHRYTTDAAVYAQMQAQGWAGEGVKFCGAP